MIGFVAYKKATQHPFNYFPFNKQGSEYRITKSENSYSLNYLKSGASKNDGSLENNKSLLIGSTPVDLDQYVDKEVKVTGSFIEAKPYCKGDCSKIGTGARPVVKIDSISLAE